MPVVPDELSICMHAVTEAGLFCRAMQHRLTGDSRVNKSDGSVVTVADYAAQALIIRRLLLRGISIPAIVGEESAGTLAAAPGLLARVVAALHETNAWADATAREVLAMIDHAAWLPDQPAPVSYITIDPIDGTKGFVHGRQYSVCLARIEHARPTLAAVCCPNISADWSHSFDENDPIGQTFGCTASSPIMVSSADRAEAPIDVCPPRTHTDLTRPRLTFSVEPSERRLEDFERISKLLGDTRPPAQIDSQCKYCIIARGQADAYYRPPRKNKEKIWDHASGCLLLERAGCLVTDVHGKPMDWSHPTLSRNDGLVGAPPELHARILRAISDGR